MFQLYRVSLVFTLVCFALSVWVNAIGTTKGTFSHLVAYGPHEVSLVHPTLFAIIDITLSAAIVLVPIINYQIPTDEVQAKRVWIWLIVQCVAIVFTTLVLYDTLYDWSLIVVSGLVLLRLVSLFICRGYMTAVEPGIDDQATRSVLHHIGASILNLTAAWTGVIFLLLLLLTVGNWNNTVEASVSVAKWSLVIFAGLHLVSLAFVLLADMNFVWLVVVLDMGYIIYYTWPDTFSLLVFVVFVTWNVVAIIYSGMCIFLHFLRHRRPIPHLYAWEGISIKSLLFPPYAGDTEAPNTIFHMPIRNYPPPPPKYTTASVKTNTVAAAAVITTAPFISTDRLSMASKHRHYSHTKQG